MTVVTVDPGGGGDYTTIMDAHNARPGTLTEIYEIQLTDDTHDVSNDYSLNTAGGLSSSNYIHITAAPGAEATSFTTGALIRSGTNGHGFINKSDYLKISNVRMENRSSSSSDEMVRNEADFCWVDRCFVYQLGAQSVDGLQCADENTFMTVTNCAFKGFGRNAIRVQTDSPLTSVADRPWIDYYHCTALDCSDYEPSDNSPDYGTYASSSYSNNANASCTLRGYNSLSDPALTSYTGSWRDYSERNNGSGDAIHEARNCISGANGAVDFGTSVTVDCHGTVVRTLIEPTSGSNMWVDDEGVLLGENAFTETQDVFDLSGHTFTDPRISFSDFATDIVGNTRTGGGSVGAYALASSGTDRTVIGTTEVIGVSANAATVTASSPRIVTGVTEVIALSENAATIEFNVPRVVTGTTETVGLAANPATVSATTNRNVTGATEVIALSENAATVSFNLPRTVTGTVEQIGLAASTAIVSRSSNREVFGTTEVLALAESAATVERDRQATGATEVIALATNPATVDATSNRDVTGATETVGLATNTATVNITGPRLVTGSTVTVALSETDANVAASRVVTTGNVAAGLNVAPGSVNLARSLLGTTEQIAVQLNQGTVQVTGPRNVVGQTEALALSTSQAVVTTAAADLYCDLKLTLHADGFKMRLADRDIGMVLCQC